MEYTQGRFVKYRLGSRGLRAHVDAVHAGSPGADVHTGEIAEEIALRSGCACIIATVSRLMADLNRPPGDSNREAVSEYRSVIGKILRNCGVLDEKTGLLTAPYLHVAVHGMTNKKWGQYAVEIGTRNGRTCSSDVREWFHKTFTALSEKLLPPGTRIIIDKKFQGDPSKALHRWGDGGGYMGYGPYFNTFQIEFSRTLRNSHREAVIELLSRMIQEFNQVCEV